MYPSIATTVLPRIEESIWFKFVLAFAGSVLLAVSAKVQIPFWPVPMTMQTFVVLVIGMAYGARLGAATVGLYLAQGAIGLPVFATGSGLGYMVGPTGGYLAGFLMASYAIGYLASLGWDRSMAKTLAAMLVCTLLIFTPGILWLSSFIGDFKSLLRKAKDDSTTCTRRDYFLKSSRTKSNCFGVTSFQDHKFKCTSER